MAKLKLCALEDDKPVKMSVELPAAVHRELLAYAEVLAQETGKPIPDPVKLIPPMIDRFMATDRVFAKIRHGRRSRSQSTGNAPPKAV